VRILQKHAAALRDQKEPNIDDLLQVLTEFVSAYKVYQARTRRGFDAGLRDGRGGEGVGAVLREPVWNFVCEALHDE
jgi:exodeoxyribonuclease VII small subunit